MDNTPKYIKMCEEAFKDIEIINHWESCYEKIPNLWAIVREDGSYCRFVQGAMPRKKGWFQVYYQDQLQKIYFSYISKEIEDDENPDNEKLTWAAFLVASLNELKLFNLAWNRGHSPFESYEQLWLALIMISEYKKYWDDSKKKWIERTNGF